MQKHFRSIDWLGLCKTMPDEEGKRTHIVISQRWIDRLSNGDLRREATKLADYHAQLSKGTFKRKTTGLGEFGETPTRFRAFYLHGKGPNGIKY